MQVGVGTAANAAQLKADNLFTSLKLMKNFKQTWIWQIVKSLSIAVGLYAIISVIKMGFEEWRSPYLSVREASQLAAQHTDWSPAALCASGNEILSHGCPTTGR
jgi:hypothetical protein